MSLLEKCLVERSLPWEGICHRVVSVLESCLHWTGVSPREVLTDVCPINTERCPSLRGLPQKGNCHRVVSAIELMSVLEWGLHWRVAMFVLRWGLPTRSISLPLRVIC